VWTGKLAGDAVTDVRALTHRNVARLAGVDLPALEPFGFKGAKGDSVFGWVLKPANYTNGKKYPTILLIHGGPQGAWFDQWHGRWNYQMFAATGAGLVIINPRGSTGYGQRFTDEISKDWGGKVVTDLMNGLDAAIARNAWIDTARLGATGGSYGGYMTNWLAGHSTRFKALVTHAGVFNLEAMAGATEEQWFTDWEFGGTWWNSTAMQQQYRKWSPHLAAGKFKTPMLVMHGELDYRVPIGEGLSLFTALQRQGVPSRMVVFPDEGHWIAKPQNQQLWWKEMQGWFTRYLMGDRPLP
jgi:dipeptidyl aminopeptidase/acylaminoacyl peptidase